MTWNGIIRTLLLVRLGQELGTASPLARAVADTVDALAAMVF